VNHHEEKDDPPINDVNDFAVSDSPSVKRRTLHPRIGGPTAMGVDIAVTFEGEVPQQLCSKPMCSWSPSRPWPNGGP
jgi:hypothetical protein